MNREDIIRMAWQAYDDGFDQKELDDLERFAELVAAHEREACAKLVEPDEEHRRDASWGYLGGQEGVELLDGKAAAIRAREIKNEN